MFPNGEVYLGELKGMLPHGNGKYTWSNGTVYDGDWDSGNLTGKGKIIWPSGASYEGDFSRGYFHGCGTLISSNGSVYKGSWKLNVQHGIGEKQYQNSDVYEGLWKEGIHEGSGRYAWSNGDIYIGTWKSGKMCGRGVMQWSNGDLFDGFWLNGLRHGSGFYRFEDGGYYFGTWTKGVKDGRGQFYPAGSKRPSLSKWRSFGLHDDEKEGSISRSSSIKSECRAIKPKVNRSLSEKFSFDGFLRGSGRISHKSISLEENWSLSHSMREAAHCHTSCLLSSKSDKFQNEVPNSGSVVYEREYMQGVLIKQRVINSEGLSNSSKERSKTKEAKIKSCANTYEDQRSYFLMLNLQLGIR